MAEREFDPFSVEFFEDPYPIYRWLRDEAPVYHNERLGFWALSRYDDVLDAHRDYATFSSTHGLTLDQLTDPSFHENYAKQSDSMIMMDPPRHNRLRKLVSRIFTPRQIAQWEHTVHELVDAHLVPLQGRREFDLLGEFAAPFPVEVICEILGVPKADRQQIRHWTDDMLHREEGNPKTTEKGIEASLYMAGYFLDLAQEKRRGPAEGDMLAVLSHADVEEEDGSERKLTDNELIGFATLLAAAGSETVTKLIGNGVVLLHRNPAEHEKILRDPDRIPDAVEEVLRYWAPSQYQGRYSLRPKAYHGVEIPAGQPVFLITGAANHDERAYEDPDRFDIDRDQKTQVGFGHGIHLCLGMHLARLESRVSFEQIYRRWPRPDVDEEGLEFVNMSNVAGFSRVPVSVAA
jgi:cytochrome P450